MPTPGSITAALDPTAPRPYKAANREYQQTVILTLVDNYVTDGVTVNLTKLNTPGFNAPYRWEFYPLAGDVYEYVVGDDRGDGKVKAYTGGTQHTSDTAWAEATLKATFWYNALGMGKTS